MYIWNLFIISEDDIETQPYDADVESRQWVKYGRKIVNKNDTAKCLQVKTWGENQLLTDLNMLLPMNNELLTVGDFCIKGILSQKIISEGNNLSQKPPFPWSIAQLHIT